VDSVFVTVCFAFPCFVRPKALPFCTWVVVLVTVTAGQLSIREVDGCCVDWAQLAEKLFTAWTSTKWPLPGQACTLCGWLLPGPMTVVPAGAPRDTAICAAVLPLPYRFDTSDLPEAIPAVLELDGAQVTEEPLPPVVQLVLCVVAFVGFIPAAEPAFWLALPFVDVVETEPDFFT
jgi:hypothetical protein